tara:strand:- start:922 stop:2103 length:1182 start_codon:yes stop_codon:yes gene_type:complete
MAAAVGAVVPGVLASCSDEESEYGVLDTPNEVLPYVGKHQAGITAPRPPAGGLVALNVRSQNRKELNETISELSKEIELLMSGEAYMKRKGGFPPLDTGILGPTPGATTTSIVLSVGSSLFDKRFELENQKPSELIEMPKFDNDYMVKPHRSHGDILLTIGAADHESVMHSLRQVLRRTRGELLPKWLKTGFNTIDFNAGPGQAPGRNLMGFKDGTSNPSQENKKLMEKIVWVQSGDDEPDWTEGGTYQAVRVIRMMTEFWDRTRLNEQESLLGRHRDSGAPVGMLKETETPKFTSFDSHIARANPRTTGSEENLILRRGFNFSDGLDQNDQLDQGLLFISYQRSLEKGFITVQNRLNGEALEEYIRPTGGGFYFALPGAKKSGEVLGSGLFT